LTLEFRPRRNKNSPMTPENVLKFWFGDLEETPAYFEFRNRMWFQGGAAVDFEIKRNFEPLLNKLIKGKYEDWRHQPEGRLAMILVLDQFSRNIFRESPKAFAQDPEALRLTAEGIALHMDQRLSLIQRIFFYLPLEHSEDLKNQASSVRHYQELHELAPAKLKKGFAETLDYAVRHQKIIERFGRFPHRNRVLQRESTPEEIEFLKQPGSSF